ncbi:MAG: iron-containing alcohol dehydrogenase, partial [Victivallaceae bacterium]|nr:iron-containing alcohol dehydrogenase [Victivallaceae bacterium]
MRYSVAIPEGMETELFLMGECALAELPAALRRYWGDAPVMLVADTNTWEVAGRKTAQILEQAGIAQVKEFVFPGTPLLHPDYRHVQELVAAMPDRCIPVSVGSGVVNDLVKCAAGEKNLRYCCIPTAPSVDGYTSSGSALSVDNFKQTITHLAPLAVVVEPAILATAPRKMLAAGYADLATKVVAGADWIIADEMKLDPIRPRIWNLVQTDLRKWLADPDNMEHIFMGLATTGYAMQLDKDSRSASGAEHLMAHIWEMENLEFEGTGVSHGFKVSIGTVVVLNLMEYVMATP